MSIEWDSLILASSELNTGPATNNARGANSVLTRGTNSRGAPAECIGLAGVATVSMGDGCDGQYLMSLSWLLRLSHKNTCYYSPD